MTNETVKGTPTVGKKSFGLGIHIYTSLLMTVDTQTFQMLYLNELT